MPTGKSLWDANRQLVPCALNYEKWCPSWSFFQGCGSPLVIWWDDDDDDDDEFL